MEVSKYFTRYIHYPYPFSRFKAYPSSWTSSETTASLFARTTQNFRVFAFYPVSPDKDCAANNINSVCSPGTNSETPRVYPSTGMSWRLIPARPDVSSQNPPTIPTLALAWLVGRIRGSKIIIDWHNLGYSILALKLGRNHPFVKIATWYVSFSWYHGLTVIIPIGSRGNLVELPTPISLLQRLCAIFSLINGTSSTLTVQ